MEQTIEDILNVRGYSRVQENEYTTVDSKRVILHYTKFQSIGKGQISSLIEYFEEKHADIGILVIPQKITSGALHSITSYAIPIQVFYENELVFNVLKHDFCPKYELVPKEEYPIIFRTFCGPDKLPQLQKNNIVARYLGVQKNDVVKVTEIVETCGTTISFLIVV